MAVGFFIQDIEFTLPHPPIPQRTVLLLCNVIRKAWQLLKEKPPSNFYLHLEHEDTITQVMVEIIENRLRRSGEVDGFNNAIYGRVEREPKITNFNKKHPDKMPDMVFDLNRGKIPILSDQDGLFVECKPVDKNHSILSCYCNKGLIRFINGDYAWAMQNAMMVGYVKESYALKNLASVLDNDKKSSNLNTTIHFADDEYEIYRSHHIRDFKWLENHGQACPITISHLWLTR